ncbi:MAG: family 10 glycosylhydrolase [Anaerolineae bacterium]|jgi:uncharacterized lipoprotein YddW (UPF0748 family)
MPKYIAFLALFLLLSTAPAVAQQAVAPAVYYYRDGQAAPVSRPALPEGERQTDVQALLESLLAGPSPEEQVQGYGTALPPGATLAGTAISGEEIRIDLYLPQAFLESELDPERSDAIVDQVVKTIHPLGLHHLELRAQDKAGNWLPLSDFLPRPVAPEVVMPGNDEPVPDQPGQVEVADGQPALFGQGRPQGALSGKAVWLSAGHGWYWSETLSRWTTQRGNNYGLVEDLSNAEAVNYYLLRYLWNAGADVWLVRDWSMNEHEIIVDNDDGAPAYTQTGSWSVSSTPGYEGGTYRWASTFSSVTSTATWTPQLPEAGWYAVWAWYRHGLNRSVDAQYEIHHAGGVSRVSLSQEVHGMTWRYLGEFYFEAGTAGHVTLLNQSADTGQVVVADAIRLGGGQGSIAETGSTSGRPRWEEATKYWARYQGAPEEISTSDVTVRPLYAEWEAAKGTATEAEDAVYISWHTNAGGGTGTESYIHSTEPTTGSIELQDAVHAELIKDLRLAWDPDWVNRGQKAADFGELRELSTIPGLLLEVAFHDTEDPGDADDLREPLFRQIAARAVYQGIVKYHAIRNGTPAYLLPEPPERLMVRNSGPGQVTVSWVPPPCCDGVAGDAATGYKVYHSTNGRAFDDGLVTTSTSATISGLAAGSLHFFRLTALNEGGESFPTPIVAVRTALVGSPVPFLIVDGFDRLDQSALVPRFESTFLGTVQRMFLERMNAYSYAVEHGSALSSCGPAFDGAVNEAVEAGDLVLADYLAVDWFTGEDSSADASLSSLERALLRGYLDGGGRLLLSGSEIGYDLVQQGRDPSFYRDYLRATYLGDSAGTYDFSGLMGAPFEGLLGRFDDGNGSSYAVGYPDRIGNTTGSTPALAYLGGTADGAGVAYADGARVIYIGFPIEAIVDSGQRQSLMCAAAAYLLDGPETLGAQRLINPGFEGATAQSAWQIQAPAEATVLAQRDSLPAYIAPFEGNWLAWLGGYSPGSPTSVALTQTVALPSGEPQATLSLAWFAQPAQVPGNPQDRLLLGVYDPAGALQATLLEVTAAPPAGTWQTAQFDLGAFSGDTVQIAFQATSQDTAFFVDQVKLDTSGPRGPDEFRALWVDAYHDGIKNRRQIDELIETAQAGSFNALVVQVRRRGDTYYPSAIDPWAPDANPAFDALAYLIEKAHAAGIEVHAWATTLAIWGSETIFPADPNHTYYLHGPGTTGQDYWLMTSYEEEEFAGDVYYLDPGHPDVVDYTVSVYAELATNYNLDGVHLDRVRYPYNDWGYNPTALARFQAQTGREDVPEPADAQWAQWRRDQLTGLVRNIYQTVGAINPRLRVSAAASAVYLAPSASRTWETCYPYARHLQDWRGWLEEGILDLAMPMNYRREDDPDWAVDFDNWIAWEKDHQYGRATVVGTGLYINSLADSMAQWLEVREPSLLGNHALGVTGYSYAKPSDEGASRRAFVNAVVSEVFTQSVRTPGLYWKGNISVYLPLVVRQSTSE